MCIPNKSKRKSQTTQVTSQQKPEAIKSCAPTQEKSPPVLVKLEVQGAIPLLSKPGTFWEALHATEPIVVTAITEPNDAEAWAELEWNVETDIPNQAKRSRSALGEGRIAVRIPGTPWKYVDFEIYDLDSVTCDLPNKLKDRDLHWKSFTSATPAKVKVTTNPDEESVWKLLKWSEGDGGVTANEKSIDLKSARDAKVSISLGQTQPKVLVADLHICQWPELEIQEIRFDAISVVGDGPAQIDKNFPRRWTKGKVEQYPLCYPAGKKIGIEATFNVIKLSTDNEEVKVKATTTLGGRVFTWEGRVQVKGGDAKASMALVLSDVALSPGVAVYDAMKLDWSMTESDGTTWKSIGSTQQTLYVTLASPVPGIKAYWTLLDLSCRAAAGMTTENTFVPAAFAPLRASTGDGNGIKRKGDGVRLSYYLQGVATSGDQAEPSVYSTRGILSRADGTGRCGGWANLLIHLFHIHGISSGKKLWFVRHYKVKPQMTNRFLVKNCAFGAGTAVSPAGYTHKGNTECVKQNGLAWPGKTNPQFDFGDHVVVEHDGKIYDPSYGVGPITGQRAYEDGALDGIGAITKGISFIQSDGTQQFISELCAKGFISHTVAGGETLASIALAFQVASAKALFDHETNRNLKASRLTQDKVKVGDIVNIPRDMTPKPMLWSQYV